MLGYLDYELIRSSPKILCGYSDITALANVITAKTGIVTYSGPHFCIWAMKKGFDYTLDYFKKCLMDMEPFPVEVSEAFRDEKWWEDQGNSTFVKNEGYQLINEGRSQRMIVGGNLCTLNLLQGTEYMPDLRASVLFLEEDELAGKYSSVEFDRNLQSLIHQPDFDKVRGVVIGRFQKNTDMTFGKLVEIITGKKELESIPVIANADFGHTFPLITFPIGGQVKLIATGENISLKIIEH